MIYKENVNAKLNLSLAITGRVDSGYHTLDTVMQTVTLSDTVTLEVTRGDTITAPLGPRDLCHKAARLFLRQIGQTADVRVSYDKQIPSQAGLGGGSGDAAAVLRVLSRHFAGAVNRQELLKIALLVGADVPFCLCGGTKRCSGFGEEMEDVAAPNRHYVIVKPPFGVVTAAAFAAWDRLGAVKQDKSVRNDFERVIDHADLPHIKATLMKHGAEYATLTGSGSAVFGSFEMKDDGFFAAVAELSKRQDYRVFQAETAEAYEF
ncbi:MAG: 4-(cytidine 5'-diphospho)-2-C-methyl-D-erythritol kinase [Oscillospiraceae bacterium]|nr:4-(cytidine 5'-diphospho)-2-C-methyl-D-erythritol kinase [Oscillospiraceae bacterium]